MAEHSFQTAFQKLALRIGARLSILRHARSEKMVEEMNKPAAKKLDVVVIGSGFAGIGMAIKLKKAGIDAYVVLEKKSAVGGVWRDNTYPGAACDVPHLLYSYSFFPNRESKQVYAPGPGILKYLEECVDKFGIRDKFEFNVEVSKAHYDEKSSEWTVSTTDGRLYQCRSLVFGVGQLSRPAIPPIANLDKFAGKMFHSSEWDHNYDLKGKRVAIVGTGASAIQIVPEIAPIVSDLKVFQRSPIWIGPKVDRFRPWERACLQKFPWMARLLRAKMYWQIEIGSARYQKGTAGNDALRKFTIDSLNAATKDPILLEKLTPDYLPGCKRIPKSNDWFKTFARDNADLVSDSIVEARPEGLLTEDRKLHACDAIIFATGFRATEFLAPIKITGRGGELLTDKWREGAQAYKGITVPSFPNMFILYGPNSNSHNSAVASIEGQVNYAIRYIKQICRAKVQSVEVKEDAFQNYSRTMQKEAHRFAWFDGCRNWYKTSKGLITNNWPGYAFKYHHLLTKKDADKYLIVK